MSLRGKLFGNGIASAGSIAWTALIQLISVPMLTSVWGLGRYGEWLMLSTIPTYFALSDLGFATAATSDMTMANARGDRESVLITFQSVWALFLIISISILLLVSPLLFVGTSILPDRPSWWPEEGHALFFMIAYSAAALCSRIVLAGFRSTGNYASGTILYDAIQALESAALIFVALKGGTFSECAIAFLLIRLMNILISYLYLRSVVDWLSLGFAMARRTELKRLFGPAIAVMAIPTAMALNIQGMILVAGAVVSPAAAGIFGAVRTISRIPIQMLGVISRASMPEFSAAMALNDSKSIKKIIRFNIFSVGILFFPGSALFAIYGASAVQAWTRGKVIPDKNFILVMSISMFFQGIWNSAANMLLSINRHGEFAKLLFVVAVFSIGCAAVVGKRYGLMGLVWSVAIADFFILVGAGIAGGAALARMGHKS